jgi:hypothetical protein
MENTQTLQDDQAAIDAAAAKVAADQVTLEAANQKLADDTAAQLQAETDAAAAQAQADADAAAAAEAAHPILAVFKGMEDEAATIGGDIAAAFMALIEKAKSLV